MTATRLFSSAWARTGAAPPRVTAPIRRVRLAVDGLEDRAVPSCSPLAQAEARVWETLASTMDTIQGQMTGVTSGDELRRVFQRVTDGLHTATTQINGLIAQAPALVNGTTVAAVTLLQGALADAGKAVQDVNQNVRTVSDQVTGLTGSSLARAKQAAARLVAEAEAFADGFRTFLHGVASGGVSEAKQAMDFVAGNVARALQFAGQGLTFVKDTVVAVEKAAIQGAKNLANGILKDVGSTLKTINDALASIQQTLTYYAGVVVGDVQAFLQTVTGQVNEAIATINGTITTLVGQVTGLVPSPDAIQQRVMALVEDANEELAYFRGELDGLKGSVDAVTQATVEGVKTLVYQAVHDTGEVLHPIVTEVEQLTATF